MRAWAAVVGVAALAAAACSSSSGASSQSGPKGQTATTPPPAAAPARASALAPKPSAGCNPATAGAHPVKTGEVTVTMTSGGKARTSLRYVPAGVARTTPMPVVFDIHGLGSNMTQQEGVTQFEHLAASEHFVVLTPDGLNARWNTIVQRPNGDVDFLMALLDRTERELCIDTARVYSTGYSDGGLMSSALACLVPDRIAAVGLVSGITHGPGCHPSRPMPIMVFWGKQDLVLPFYGGLGEALRDLLSGKAMPQDLKAPTAPIPVAQQDGFPPVEQVVSSWADTDGCPSTPTKVAVASDVEQRIYVDCRDASSIRFYVVSDGGHAWPGSKLESAAGAANPTGQAAIIGYTTMKISARDLIWKFFRQYALSS
jgi:polyhydroxybutyrate depolymerase